MHIGSGSVLEVDAALSILVDLVQRHSDKMAQFAIFIKGIIDYMDNLSSAQIRKLYLMLSVLSFQTDHGRTLIQVNIIRFLYTWVYLQLLLIFIVIFACYIFHTG